MVQSMTLMPLSGASIPMLYTTVAGKWVSSGSKKSRSALPLDGTRAMCNHDGSREPRRRHLKRQGTTMAIIAITQHVGMRGADLARLTAERLGYRLLNAEQLVAATSRTYSVPAEALAIVDERRPTFWTRFKTDTGRFTAFFRAVVLK